MNRINKYLQEFPSFHDLDFSNNNNYYYTDNHITYYVLMERGPDSLSIHYE